MASFVKLEVVMKLLYFWAADWIFPSFRLDVDDIQTEVTLVEDPGDAFVPLCPIA